MHNGQSAWYNWECLEINFCMRAFPWHYTEICVLNQLLCKVMLQLGTKKWLFCCWKCVDLGSNIPASSANCSITPLVLELSQYHLLWGEFSSHSGIYTNHISIFFILPGTYYSTKLTLKALIKITNNFGLTLNFVLRIFNLFLKRYRNYDCQRTFAGKVLLVSNVTTSAVWVKLSP